MRHENLKKVADALNLSEIDRYQRKRRQKTGRKGNNISSFVRAFFVQDILHLPSERQLANALKKDDELRHICGFRKAVNHSTYGRARKRLGIFGMKFLFDKLVAKAREIGLISGRFLVADSTDFRAYSRKKRKFLERSDKCARVGHTSKGKVFGYKAHIIADAEAELPVSVVIMPANVHDKIGFVQAYREMKRNFHMPAHKMIADCAYDSTDVYQMLGDTKPVIAINGRGHYASRKPSDPDYKKRSAIERINSRLKIELCLDELKLKGLWGATVHGLRACCSMLFAAIGSKLAEVADWRGIVNLR